MPTLSPSNGIESTVMNSGATKKQGGRIGERDRGERSEERHVRDDHAEPARDVQARAPGAKRAQDRPRTAAPPG